jgi:hypothetical protein
MSMSGRDGKSFFDLKQWLSMSLLLVIITIDPCPFGCCFRSQMLKCKLLFPESYWYLLLQSKGFDLPCVVALHPSQSLLLGSDSWTHGTWPRKLSEWLSRVSLDIDRYMRG